MKSPWHHNESILESPGLAREDPLPRRLQVARLPSLGTDAEARAGAAAGIGVAAWRDVLQGLMVLWKNMRISQQEKCRFSPVQPSDMVMLSKTWWI